MGLFGGGGAGGGTDYTKATKKGQASGAYREAITGRRGALANQQQIAQAAGGPGGMTRTVRDLQAAQAKDWKRFVKTRAAAE